MDDVLGLFAGGALTNIAGAAFGLLGGYLAKREARKMAELQFAHDENMAKHEAAEAREERLQAVKLGDQNIHLAEVEGSQRVEEATVSAFADSIVSQGKSVGSPILDFLLRLIRPAITFWLIWELHKLQTALHDLIGGLEGLDQAVLTSLYTSIVDAIIFLAITAVGWWFASRKGQIHNAK